MRIFALPALLVLCISSFAQPRLNHVVRGEVKDARTVEELAHAQTALIAENGGLTGGAARCEGCVLTPGVSESMLLALAACGPANGPWGANNQLNTNHYGKNL